jgi:hypothetical protein
MKSKKLLISAILIGVAFSGEANLKVGGGSVGAGLNVGSYLSVPQGSPLSVNIGGQNYNALSLMFDTSKWVDIFNKKMLQLLGNVEDITTPIGTIKMSNILKDLYNGVACLIPTYMAKAGLDFKIPTHLTVHLPCQDVTIDWSPVINKMMNKINNTVNGAIGDRIQQCLKSGKASSIFCRAFSGSFESHSGGGTTIGIGGGSHSGGGGTTIGIGGKSSKENNPIHYYYQYKDYILEANSEMRSNYQDRTNEDINKEVKKDIKSLSVNTFPIATNQKTVYNKAIYEADMREIKFAGSSYGHLVFPDKKQASGLPSDLKQEYGWLVSKQVAREKTVEAIKNHLNEIFEELASIKQIIDTTCNGDIPSEIVIPPTIGLPKGGKVPVKTSNVDISKYKQLALYRVAGECVPVCEKISGQIADIEKDTKRISGQIEKLGKEIASSIKTSTGAMTKTIAGSIASLQRTIALEEYFTRKQIHNEIMNQQANMKTLFCTFVKVKYLQIKTNLYLGMIQYAQLQALYSLLENKEKDKFMQDYHKAFKKSKKAIIEK